MSPQLLRAIRSRFLESSELASALPGGFWVGYAPASVTELPYAVLAPGKNSPGYTTCRTEYGTEPYEVVFYAGTLGGSLAAASAWARVFERFSAPAGTGRVVTTYSTSGVGSPERERAEDGRDVWACAVAYESFTSGV